MARTISTIWRSPVGVLLLVRHGQASLGAANYDQLSPLGQQQAHLVAARLAQGSPIHRVLCGTLARQRKTADAIAAAVGVTILDTSDRWDEYDHVDILADRASAFVFDTDTPNSRDAATTALEEALQRWMRSAIGYAESHDTFLTRVRSAVGTAAELPGVSVAVSSGG
jgi:broad specificity phosphatase PhoE